MIKDAAHLQMQDKSIILLQFSQGIPVCMSRELQEWKIQHPCVPYVYTRLIISSYLLESIRPYKLIFEQQANQHRIAKGDFLKIL